MVEASFLDLHNTKQLIVLCILIMALIILLYLSIYFFLKKEWRRSFVSLFLSSVQLLLIFLGWHLTFPYLGTYCPMYEDDKILVLKLQNELNSFKDSCGRFPTSSEGLEVLLKDNGILDCDYQSNLDSLPLNSNLQSLVYKQVNSGYELSSYEINSKIYIIGTEKHEAKYFKLESK